MSLTSLAAGHVDRMPASVRTSAAAAVGVVAGITAAFFTFPQAAALIGWDVSAVTFLLGVWLSAWRLGADSTKQSATRLDPSRGTADLLVIAAGVAILAAVALALARAGNAHGGTKAYLLAVGLVSVVLSWLTVHSVFTLNYARLFYSAEEGGINFNDPERPDYRDFAYLAFTIGMTFQVSDTDITAKRVRRTALHHALISYLFGAVIIALVINIVASLL